MSTHNVRGGRRPALGSARVIGGLSLATVLAASGLALGTPGSALAATPATVKLGSSNGFGGELIYNGGTGNASNLRIVREGGKIAVTDGAPITVGAGCVSVTATKALCDQTFGGRQVMRVSAQLGDLNDRVSVEGRFVGQILAGAGNDFLLAGQKDCCGDSQFIYNGGPDFDTVSYERAVTAVTVTLDDVNNDGLIKEFGTSRDDIGDTVEQVIGSAFADKLTGDERFNGLFGLGGADTIDPGAGSDRVFGDGGNDVVLVKDGADDLVDGGSGTDTATIDKVDSLTSVETTK
jgi:Ca2+-binding RTX toxin-like protein